ncbi:hypothetical protein BDV25DRAFT_150732 [Aspergillus avenaceus]|uniref:Uncharacterized protein n=1 Tax=Aspergillus avenaceus TaxID=36643 RepID=A0A5N6U1Y6_ASPAV|nr:hypothetical protein BDV25DRAFT_150732 [Aspergillus avenaceus]
MLNLYRLYSAITFSGHSSLFSCGLPVVICDIIRAVNPVKVGDLFWRTGYLLGY